MKNYFLPMSIKFSSSTHQLTICAPARHWSRRRGHGWDRQTDILPRGATHSTQTHDAQASVSALKINKDWAEGAEGVGEIGHLKRKGERGPRCTSGDRALGFPNYTL